MDLDYYLWKNKIPHKTFAKSIGVSPPSFSFFVNKKRSPFLGTAIKIHCETKKAVSLWELLTLEDRKKLEEDGFALNTFDNKDEGLELDYYLWRNKILNKTFAKNLGICSRTLGNIVNKKHSPLLITAIKIHCETKGAVPMYELLSLKDREEIEKKYSFVTKDSIYNVDDKEDK